MRNRMSAATAAVMAAAFAAVALGGCSAPSQGQLASTATATVNGTEVRPGVVRCYQQEWYRTIALGNDESGATVVIDQRKHPATTVSVRFHNFGGFTGTTTAAPGGGGAAETRFDGSNFLISGTVNGATTAKPTEAVAADFKIKATC
ncbi:hypothetical protein A5634_08850 [Mycobacterium asiaticum]|uniref:Lipoprotein LpqH n=1 Tax=Mycobacterium asiaticum TaxID=1790 RepID=A0A1A3NLH8_MYCAS|nr:lipoprotein LpqH [Mycobacterium asiaticum]OBK21904.1 hypothetical protein A5634_08850 [Mycobacterium asiaticum]